MSDSMQTTLLALKDVQGIQGSFVLNGDGKLLAMQMPALFDVSMFVELGPRIERLAESFTALGDELESCLIRFADHLLCIKRFAKGGALCILTSRSVNLPALKMAVNLGHKRVAEEVATAQPLAVAAAAPVAAPPSAPPAPAASAALPAFTAPLPGTADRKADGKTPRYYRGHLVED